MDQRNALPVTVEALLMIPTVEQFVSSVVDKYIVRPTSNPNLIGVGGFLFDIDATQEISLDAEVTDHYTEDNYAIQDHVALRPKMVTLRGYIGELKDMQAQSLLPVLTNIQSLASIGGFMPQFAAQATQVYSKITDVTSKIDSVINQANNVFDIFTNKSTTANYQQKAYMFFEQLRDSMQLCTVETPYKIFNNMVITSLRAIQKDDTNIISDFAVTFKEIRTANTIYETTATPVLSGRAAAALAPTVNNGQVTGKIVNVNILDVAYKGQSVL
jgi:hypothetical protein